MEGLHLFGVIHLNDTTSMCCEDEDAVYIQEAEESFLASPKHPKGECPAWPFYSTAAKYLRVLRSPYAAIVHLNPQMFDESRFPGFFR